MSIANAKYIVDELENGSDDFFESFPTTRYSTLSPSSSPPGRPTSARRSASPDKTRTIGSDSSGTTGVSRAQKIGGALAWSTVSSAATDTDSEDDRRPAADPEPEPEPAGAEGGVGVDVDALTFKRELTAERREVLEAWLTHVREGEDGVTQSDFTAWWDDDRAAGTGYNKPGSVWEAFVKAAMKQSEQFHTPNARTYRWVGGE
jgi:hypothetical protein